MKGKSDNSIPTQPLTKAGGFDENAVLVDEVSCRSLVNLPVICIEQKSSYSNLDI